jgi:DNA-binding NtrC family response regulator
MQTVLSHKPNAAAASVSVLITGETGTGKEVLAHAIHRMGPYQ